MECHQNPLRSYLGDESRGDFRPRRVDLSRKKMPVKAASTPHPYKKKKIPKALREAVWIKHAGKNFQMKCSTPWCPNTISSFDFQTGHNIPESKGGATTIDNLVPICSRCNQSMSNVYTFDEWCKLNAPPKPSLWARLFCCVGAAAIQPIATVSPAASASGSKPTRHS